MFSLLLETTYMYMYMYITNNGIIYNLFTNYQESSEKEELGTERGSTDAKAKDGLEKETEG